MCVSDKNFGILFPTFYFQGYIGSVSERTVTQSSSIWWSLEQENTIEHR